MLSEILTDIIEKDLWDDRREYDQCDLKRAYDLNDHDANTLYKVIQGETDLQCNIAHQTLYKAKWILEQIQIADHDGYNGFNEEEQVIIKAFLSDICSAANKTKGERNDESNA